MHKIIIIAALALTACAEPKPDYAAQGRCQELGHAPGTAAYDDCLKEQRTQRMMEQQRQEFEDMKRYREEWRMRRY